MGLTHNIGGSFKFVSCLVLFINEPSCSSQRTRIDSTQHRVEMLLLARLCCCLQRRKKGYKLPRCSHVERSQSLELIICETGPPEVNGLAMASMTVASKLYVVLGKRYLLHIFPLI